MAYKIIIIDDEKEISNGFAKYFPWEELGYSVAGQFTDAASALSFLEHDTVDLVVSDILMPDMTGLDLTRAIAQYPEETRPRIVLFSAYDKFEYAQEAIDLGCIKYILKTVCYDELISIFADLKNRLQKPGKVREESAGGAEDDYIVAAMKRYTEGHLVDANLMGAARSTHISASYASRYFKQKAGMNYMTYVQKCKMEYAAALLRDSHHQIGQISEMVGYSNAFNFSRSFRAWFGRSPREYRNLFASPKNKADRG